MMEKFAELINSDTPVVADFYADWCGPCQTMMPLIKQVAEKLKGKARVIKINVDRNESAAHLYNVRSVPTFIIFKGGKQVWRHSGTIDAATLERQVLSFQ
jgi:thioredoxin 1